jgi:hypothetical protein
MGIYDTTTEAARGVLDVARDINAALDEADKYTGGKSLIDVSKNARVEPLFIVDSALLAYEHMPDIAQTMQSIFAGYYLQAVEHITTIGGIKVTDKLAPLNPNRKVDIGLMSENVMVPYAQSACASVDEWRLKADSYTFTLPTTKNRVKIGNESMVPTMSTETLRLVREPIKSIGTEADDDKKDKNSNFKDAGKVIGEVAALSVGKLYTITLKNDKQSVPVTVAIRLMARTIPTSSLTSIFTFNNREDMDFMERVHGWRSGRLELINDLILCNDLVDAHRKNLINDKTGLYQEILSRQNNGLAAGLLERNPSLAVASNLCVIDSSTLAAIEIKMGGAFDNYKVRREVFNTTNMMIMAVVDRGYDRVTFYHRGIATTTEMSIRDIKVSNKGNGPDVTDILKAFMGGKAPVL